MSTQVKRDNTYVSDSIFRLVGGITKATRIIRDTYGPAGGNVVLEEEGYPYHSVRNDGKTIVDKIKYEDALENIGANIIKEAGDKADKDSGDGRKTTMILVDAIFKEYQGGNIAPMEVKKSLDACVPLICEKIDSMKREISIDNIKDVATIASESESLGAIIQEVYQKIGEEGIIEVDHSNFPETTYEITEGVRVRNARAFGSYSFTEPGKAVFKDAYILVAKDKISTTSQLEPLFQQMSQKGKTELVIYCDEIDMSVAELLAGTHLRGGFKTLIVKSPTIWKDLFFDDVAKITGATPIDAKNGKTFFTLTMDDLGQCEKVVSNKDETRFIGIKDISEHIKALEEENTDNSKLRLSWLRTKVAILKVGANSESELSYVSKKAKDACHAAYLALKEGVVAGGGVTLSRIADEMPDTIGGNILRMALEHPFNQNLTNLGIGAVERSFDFGPNVIDPAIVVKNAVKNAVSIASTVITLRGIITLPEYSHENTRTMPGM